VGADAAANADASLIKVDGASWIVLLLTSPLAAAST
jgi:hypothetical protein